MRFLCVILLLISITSCSKTTENSHTLLSANAFDQLSKAPVNPPPNGFDSLVVFGDSLSDMGTYTVLALQTYGLGTRFNVPFHHLPYPDGGQFTVNSSQSRIWVSDMAEKLHLTLNPNVVTYGTGSTATYLMPSGGFTHQPSICLFGSSSRTQPASCLDFAQGGALVNQSDGIDHESGAMTLPASRQVSHYLAEFKQFNNHQLIVIFIGSNDILLAFSGFLQEMTESVQQQVSQTLKQDPDSGLIHEQTAATLAMARAYPTALAHAFGKVDLAADDLARLASRIVHHQGRYILVYTIPDIAQTPFGRGLPYTLKNHPGDIPDGYQCHIDQTDSPCHILSQLVNRFNHKLLRYLQKAPVKIVDSHALFHTILDNPLSFGFTETHQPWCSPNIPSSLLCNLNTPNTRAGANTDNLSTWLFADQIHPTPAGHEALTRYSLQSLQDFHWITAP